MTEKTNQKTLHHLKEVLEWAKGNRGSKVGNPYLFPEVKAALQHLAELQGLTGDLCYLDAKTENTKEGGEDAKRMDKRS